MTGRPMTRGVLFACATFVAMTTLAAGAVKTAVYSRNLAKPITDFHFTIGRVHIKAGGRVQDINAAVRLNHSYTCDLVLGLVAPNGRAVNLSDDNCTTGPNYGSGPNTCKGKLTVFDDQAARSITSAGNPYVGPFKPEQHLSAFNGSQTRGTWDLVVYDGFSEDHGKLGCVKLKIKRRT